MISDATKRAAVTLGVAAALVVSGPLRAQAPDTAPPTAPSPAAPTLRTSTKPLPVVFSSPTTGVAFGVTAIHVRQSLVDTTQRPITIRGATIYSLKNQFEALVDVDAWTPGNKMRIAGTAEFNIFPSPFYGIGPNTPESASEDYTPRSIALDGSLQREVAPHIFAKLLGRFQTINIKTVAPGGLLAADTIIGSRGSTVVSLGAGVVVDTRDNVYTPKHGVLLQSRAAFAEKWLGSTQRFELVNADLRGYRQMRPGGVLAVQFQLEGSAGDVPFFDLPNLGGPDGLRPYVNGRWRDRVQLTTQVEWRQQLAPRWGAVAFTGGGMVAPRIGAFDLHYFRPEVGLGVRYKILPKDDANLRADFALGQGGSKAFTLGFAEGF